MGTHTSVAAKKNEPSDVYTSTWTLDVVSSPVISRGVQRRVISLRRRMRSHPRSQEGSTRFRGMRMETRCFWYHPLHSGSIPYTYPERGDPQVCLISPGSHTKFIQASRLDGSSTARVRGLERASPRTLFSLWFLTNWRICVHKHLFEFLISYLILSASFISLQVSLIYIGSLFYETISSRWLWVIKEGSVDLDRLWKKKWMGIISSLERNTTLKQLHWNEWNEIPNWILQIRMLSVSHILWCVNIYWFSD